MTRPGRGARDTERLHERARLLASEAIDTDLQRGDAEWLAAHLDGCPECRTVADDYCALRDELRSLAVPEPPRDLWARTSAALDEIDRSSRRKGPAALPGFGGWAASRSSLGAALAVALVVVISGVSLLSQVPATHVPGSTATGRIAFVPTPPLSAEAPVAVVDGTGYWIKRNGETYQIRSGAAKCSGPNDRCSVSSDSGTTIGSITSDSPVFAALAPDARQAAVWNGSTVAILPLAAQQPATVAMDQATPRPVLTSSATATVALPTPTATATSSSGASALPTPVSSGTVAPSESPAESATLSPPASASPSPVSVPTAILNGYKVIGRDPEFSSDGQWVAFSAAPTNFSNGPDLFVWQVGQERAVAVTSAHADFFSGWFGSQILVSELASGPAASAPSATPYDSPTASPTDSGNPSASLSDGAASPSITQPPSGPSATSYLFDPVTQSAQRIDRQMLLPEADPTRTFLVYWSGTIESDAASGRLQPGTGSLYLDSWSNLKLEPASLDGTVPVPSASPIPSATPSATASAAAGQPSATPTPEATASGTFDGATQSSSPEPSPSPALPQLLKVAGSDGVQDWVVEWDASGQHVAIWVADPASQTVGVVNLFAIDRGTGTVATDGPLFHARGLASIQFDNGRLVYTTPAEGSDGKTYLVPLPPTPPSASPSASASPSPSPSLPSGATKTPGQVSSATPMPTAASTDGPGS
jgi:hypothetical protein